MSKRPATPKIPIDTGRKLRIHGNRISVRGSVRYFRKESNRDLIHKALLKKGKARLNVRMRIRHHDSLSYLGWNGWSVMVDVASVKQAEQFNLEVESAIIAIGERLGATVKVERNTAHGDCKHRIS